MEPRLGREWSERMKTKGDGLRKWGEWWRGSVRRDGENWPVQDGEWGNIFHFPFPSSPCQDTDRYPLELIPSLCRGVGGKIEAAVYYWPSWVRWNGLKAVENSISVRGNGSPVKCGPGFTLVFGRSNLKRFLTKTNVVWLCPCELLPLNKHYLTFSPDFTFAKVPARRRWRFTSVVFYSPWLLSVHHTVVN